MVAAELMEESSPREGRSWLSDAADDRVSLCRRRGELEQSALVTVHVGNGRRLHGVAHTVAASALYIETCSKPCQGRENRRVAVGRRVEVTLALGEWQVLVTGRVIQASTDGLGLSLDERHREQMVRFLEHTARCHPLPCGDSPL